MERFIKKLMLSDSGFSLVEIIVAMLILSLFVVVYATSATTSFKEYKTAGNRTIALNYAKQILEETRVLVMKPVVDDTEKAFTDPDYTFKVAVDLYNPSISSNLYTVSVSVYYQENQTKKHVDLSTLSFWVK